MNVEATAFSAKNKLLSKGGKGKTPIVKTLEHNSGNERESFDS